MKKSVANEIKMQMERQHALPAKDNKFTGPIRNMDSFEPLYVGDIIIIPKDYQVMKTVIGEGEYKRSVEYINVEVKNPDGVERIIRFFPNMLAKIAFPIIDGRRAPKVKTTGEAAQFYSKFENIDDAVRALSELGRGIKITDDQTFTVSRPFSTGTMTTHIYRYD